MAETPDGSATESRARRPGHDPEAGMSDFIFLFRSNAMEHEQHMGTQERAQESMAGWLVWVRDLEAKGHLKDPGQPLAAQGAVVKGAGKLVTDGPYVEAKDLVLGYMLIEARDLAQATELAKGCPMLEGDGSVEIRAIEKLSF
jgi:hypothetical protein